MERIKTKLKFVKSDKTGAMVGFISKNTKTGQVRGIRADDKLPKQICVASAEIAPYIEENVLYDVILIPMNTKTGYIAIQAEPVGFKATIESCVVKKAVYRVEVKFGNKTIVFDPMDGKKESVKTIAGVLSVLRSRKDIKDYMEVEEEFLKAANIVAIAFRRDGFYYV